jgi:hypothetical protein
MSNGNAQGVIIKPIMATEATLRDMFAGQVLSEVTGLVGIPEDEDIVDSILFSVIAKVSYGIADAMLLERSKTKE